MNIVMIGAGYVGLATGACFAELGHDVTCVDRDAARIRRLRGGEMPIYEPGLDDLIGRHSAAGRIHFAEPSAVTLRKADVVFIAVGTPSGEHGEIDLRFVEGAARDIAQHLTSGTLVVIKSTVVAGTARRLRSIIAEIRGRQDIAVASNPEFLREGSAIADFLEADRIVLGTDESRSTAMLEAVYEPLVRRGVPLITTTTVSAELIKYAANSFLALKIGFVNDVADLCEATGGDIEAVTLGVGLDSRIGPSFLAPGPGFGGSCFPKDTRAFARTGRAWGAPQPLIECLIARNEERKDDLARRVISELARTGGRTAAILGAAFKANTDDVRESAVLTIVPLLHEAGIRVRGHDPKAMPMAAALLTGVDWCDSPYDAARGADVVVVLTEWEDYRDLELRRLGRAMRGRTLLDFRNLLDPAAVRGAGLRYLGLGRPEPADSHRRAAGPARLDGGLAAAPA